MEQQPPATGRLKGRSTTRCSRHAMPSAKQTSKCSVPSTSSSMVHNRPHPPWRHRPRPDLRNAISQMDLHTLPIVTWAVRLQNTA